MTVGQPTFDQLTVGEMTRYPPEVLKGKTLTCHVHPIRWQSAELVVSPWTNLTDLFLRVMLVF